ncbi:DUF1311 domain-containing protein [Pseudoduganella sp. DS3]|uniref:DUF1311 domain-containing protein n=1 Tax=Pseudoduganella guangdongensis TaxID=2692179 RepID=A0A6N9HDB9_9BURK|nr:DUF1311 domain-containing protein [Pseudoduganella guangdongensis]
MRRAYAFVLLAMTAGAHAENAECERHLLATYPFPHRPTAEQTAALQDCDADKLYYGIGQHFNYVKARHCAFAKDNHEVLMMLYANGLGVPRNYAVAKMAACRADSAPMVTAGRLESLGRMQTGKEGPSPKIDMCDDASSGVLLGRCVGIKSALVAQEREDKFERLANRWSDAEKAALQLLRKRASAFAEAHGRGEVDLSGSARSAFVGQAINAQEDDFLKSLQEFEAGKLPAFTQSDFAQADKELNLAYQRLKAQKDPDYVGGVTFAEIQGVQRNWLAYRDAWVAFGKVRYPAVAPHAWRAYFTQKRTAMLNELAAARN